MPLWITTEKKCCKYQHFRPEKNPKIRGLDVAPGGTLLLLLLLPPPLPLLLLLLLLL